MKKTMEINRLPYELVSYQVTTQNIFWMFSHVFKLGIILPSEWIIKQLLNLAFVSYEELWSSRRVLSAP